jgi:hypothetical protein
MEVFACEAVILWRLVLLFTLSIEVEEDTQPANESARGFLMIVNLWSWDDWSRFVVDACNSYGG